MNMYKVHRVQGYDQYEQLVSQPDLTSADRTVVFFYGTGNESRLSWCPDCVNVMPSIEKLLKTITASSNDTTLHFVYAAIDRDDWKSGDCKFRTAPNLQLTKIPTLIRLKGGREERRLVEKECMNGEALRDTINI